METLIKRIIERTRTSIEITTVMGCRVNCKYCPQNNLIKRYYSEDKKRKQKLSFEDFKICIDKLPPKSTIVFSGAAEPMLNDEVYDMIAYAASSPKNYSIRLFTTLEGMTLEGFRAIKDVPFETVVLHAPDADGYANITLNEKYFDLLDEVLNQKKKDGSWFVDECNCQGVFHPLFLEHVNRNVLGVDRKTILHDRGGNLSNESEELDSRRLSGTIVCGGSFPKLNHWLLMPDCSVYLCCMDFGLRHYLGNLKTESLKKIKESNELRTVYNNMLFDRGDAILCRQCSYARTVKELMKGRKT